MSFNLNKSGTFDRVYENLKEEELKAPYLRDPGFCCYYKAYEKTDRDRYDSYCAHACRIWNFLETVYDRASRKGASCPDGGWMLVMMQENKLHYRWFLANRSDFQKSFQDFVMLTLNEVELSDGTAQDYDRVYGEMLKAFPAEELKEKAHVIRLLESGIYRLSLLKFVNRSKEDSSFIGYALYYLSLDGSKLFLDYLNILSEYQDCSYGSKILGLLSKKISAAGGTGIFFEIEPPVDEITKARARFYHRNGAGKIGGEYYLPTPDGSIPLDLMILPVNGKTEIRKEETRDFVKEAVMAIHSDYSHTGAVIEKYYSSIEDFKAD